MPPLVGMVGGHADPSDSSDDGPVSGNKKKKRKVSAERSRRNSYAPKQKQWLIRYADGNPGKPPGVKDCHEWLANKWQEKYKCPFKPGKQTVKDCSKNRAAIMADSSRSVKNATGVDATQRWRGCGWPGTSSSAFEVTDSLSSELSELVEVAVSFGLMVFF
ncbi:hypothetical protein COO60DRAFT_1532543 [Scenedesmus sp. NREL 46B-D3]|nr:hypothetical protein COO60DRAFT_1532543 [Scenedesmus sp. NREL 46B-D3]